jgi:2-polyprenyl-3-methyl-5-hydroxy-6-metoxy-1,4-benzoquinol methylase
LESDDSRIALARVEGQLVGYAIAVQTRVPDYGVVSWVTQLVVHERYRNVRIGTSLLFSIWSFTDHFAWGLTTANPYAVRALEKATRRRCTAERIARNRRKLLAVGAKHVHFIKPDTVIDVARDRARINTEFFVDHASLDAKLRGVVTPDTPWTLGALPEGWEWLAFTFQDQPQVRLTPGEIDQMVSAADEVTKKAYSRMALAGGGHAWTRFTSQEVDEIAAHCGLHRGSVVFDFGCGEGRHAIELGLRGHKVTGVDYLENFVEAASRAAAERRLADVSFVLGDCREISLPEQADAIICLYDVVGTYGDNAENQMILANLARHLKPAGRTLISVMNREPTERLARNWFSLSEDPDALLRLPPSRTMEQTGNIFNPEYYMVDRETLVVYRKEQFESPTSLPAELVVRDRRFTVEEIVAMCEAAGLRVLWTRNVRSGAWNTPLDRADDRAKEILVLCGRVG